MSGSPEAPADSLPGRLLDDLVAADRATWQQLVTAHPRLVERSSLAQLCAEVAAAVGSDLRRARRLAQAARWLARRGGDPLSCARSDRAAANALHFAGRVRRAQTLYRSALDAFEAMGESAEGAITRSSALLNLAYLGHYEEAEAWAVAAREVFTRLGDRLRLAMLDHNVANLLSRQDRWDEALVAYTSAYRELESLQRPHDVAVCLRNMAVCHINRHRFPEAMAAYERCREHCRRRGLAQMLHEVDYNVAYLFYLRGQYTDAIRLFQAARRQAEEDGDTYHHSLCNLDLSELYLELNLVADGEARAQEALAGFQRSKTPYETAKALTNLGVAAGRLGNAEVALERLAAARRIFVREHNHLWPPMLDILQAVVLLRAGRAAEAAPLAEAARRSFARFGVAPKEATCELLLAELALELGRPDRARETCHRALRRLADLDLPALQHYGYSVLGRVEEAAGDGGAAITAYRSACSLLERLRSQLLVEDLKVSFLADKHAIYESLVWLEWRGLAETAVPPSLFDTIERAKSRSLAEILAFRASELVSKRPHGDGRLSDRIRRLREELSWLYRRIDAAQMDSAAHQRREVDDLLRRAHALEADLLRLLRELRVADPELGSLTAGWRASSEALQGSLPAGSVLIEYFVARGAVLACVLDHRGVRILEAASARRVRRHHRFLQLQLSQAGLAEPRKLGGSQLAEEAVKSHLAALYDELIAPLEPHLEAEHLFIAPHSFLHFVPFHALLDGDRYLVDRHSVSYVPSGSVLLLCLGRQPSWEERSLVLGVADQRAPAILEEASTVAGLLPDAMLLTGAEASAGALGLHGPRCRFIHIATHGLFRQDHPMFSAIQMGDSRLSLFDLYALELHAELVVLSGCGTGLQAVVGADELVGLTRGLLYAGAHAALVSLWDVHDASATRLMRTYYEQLTRGGGAARALRLAMLDLRQESPHPYHWAPFIVVGNPLEPAPGRRPPRRPSAARR